MRLSSSQQDVLLQLEAGGRLVEDEFGSPWIEDAHGGRRRIRKPTLDSLVRRGHFDPNQMVMPKVVISVEGNCEKWRWWLEGIFGSEEYSKATKERKREMVYGAAKQITEALKRASETARLYIPEIIG
jgi:hypothetical protein